MICEEVFVKETLNTTNKLSALNLNNKVVILQKKYDLASRCMDNLLAKPEDM